MPTQAWDTAPDDYPNTLIDNLTEHLVTGKAAIFDLDGTLLDTLDDLADSGNAALTECGFPTHPVDAYRHFVGDGVGMLVRRILPEDKQDEETMLRVGAEYRRQYTARWTHKTKPYDGVCEMLDALVERKIRMAVLSNKPDDFTQQCVSEFLGDYPFDPILGHHDGMVRKPDPGGAIQIAADWQLPPGEIVYVGDTATDMRVERPIARLVHILSRNSAMPAGVLLRLRR